MKYLYEEYSPFTQKFRRIYVSICSFKKQITSWKENKPIQQHCLVLQTISDQLLPHINKMMQEQRNKRMSPLTGKLGTALHKTIFHVNRSFIFDKNCLVSEVSPLLNAMTKETNLLNCCLLHYIFQAQKSFQEKDKSQTKFSPLYLPLFVIPQKMHSTENSCNVFGPVMLETFHLDPGLTSLQDTCL